MFQTAILLSKENTCAKLFWNPCIYVVVMAQKSSFMWPSSVTLTFNLPKNVSNGTSPPKGQQLCQIILKAMHKCRSYGPDKSGRTHARTRAQCAHTKLSKKVTAMSRFTASGLDKKEQYSCLYSRAKSKVWLYSYSIHVIGCSNIQSVILPKST